MARRARTTNGAPGWWRGGITGCAAGPTTSSASRGCWCSSARGTPRTGTWRRHRAGGASKTGRWRAPARTPCTFRREAGSRPGRRAAGPPSGCSTARASASWPATGGANPPVTCAATMPAAWCTTGPSSTPPSPSWASRGWCCGPSPTRRWPTGRRGSRTWRLTGRSRWWPAGRSTPPSATTPPRPHAWCQGSHTRWPGSFTSAPGPSGPGTGSGSRWPTRSSRCSGPPRTR